MPFEPFQVGEEVKPSFDLLPVDKYNLAFTKVDMKPTSSGGEMLALQAQVQDGKYQGRLIFTNLNLVAPPNPTEGQVNGVAIAVRTRDEICRALGKVAIKTPEELIGIPFVGQVEVEKGSNGYADSNKIKKFLPRTASTPVSGTAPW